MWKSTWRALGSLQGFVLFGFLFGGCAQVDEGPERFRVWGTVVFDGRPVPHGSVIFDPDVQAGNSGPQGSATIVDGVYDTNQAGGRGVTRGPMIISITGMQNPHAVEGEDPGILFADYSVRQVISENETELNFAVPKESKFPLPRESR